NSRRGAALVSDKHGNPVCNFSYVDEIYDGLLENGVRPFVALSFMPRKLAALPSYHVFWYHPLVAPPKRLRLEFRGIAPDSVVSVRQLDDQHGNTLAAYRALGSPRYSSRHEVEEINRRADVSAQGARLDDGSLTLVLPPDALALIEIAPAGGAAGSAGSTSR
ncbi:MAG TPA: hypothetical protein VLX90_12270, partial [Steroidobacteraceae bacterium]|nr:hypothetical protein [Steroidobacteraceae bacterium]